MYGSHMLRTILQVFRHGISSGQADLGSTWHPPMISPEHIGGFTKASIALPAMLPFTRKSSIAGRRRPKRPLRRFLEITFGSQANVMKFICNAGHLSPSSTSSGKDKGHGGTMTPGPGPTEKP